MVSFENGRGLLILTTCAYLGACVPGNVEAPAAIIESAGADQTGSGSHGGTPPDPNQGEFVGESPNRPGPQMPQPEEDPNRLTPSQVFQCAGPGREASEPRIRRYGQHEWSAKRKAFVEKGKEDGNPLLPPPDVRYSTFSQRDTMDVATTERMLEVAEWTASQFDFGREDRCMTNDGDPGPDCLRNFVNRMMRSAWLRPPSQEETEFFTALLEDWLATDSKLEAARQAVALIWAAPESVYRTELGQTNGSERAPLAPFELANAIVHALTDGSRQSGKEQRNTMNALYRAAEEARLVTAQQVEPFVRDLIWRVDGDSNEEPSVKTERFFYEFFGLDRADEVFKDEPAATSKYDKANYAPNYFAGMSWNTIRRALKQDEQVLRTLLTDTRLQTFGVDEGRNRVFGTFDETTETSPGGLIDFEGERAGLLTHPSWLAAWGHNAENDSSPVARGKWVLENLLCKAVPDLPIDVAAVLPDEPDWSARQRLAYATEPLATDSAERKAEKEYCWQCHKLMNPFGLPFEVYNHAGFLRKEDHGGPPDGSSTLVETGDPNLDGRTVQDALELTELLAESAVVEQCFIRQIFRFYVGRPETSADACTLSSMLETYQATNGSFEETLVTLMTSDTFIYRTRGGQ